MIPSGFLRVETNVLGPPKNYSRHVIDQILSYLNLLCSSVTTLWQGYTKGKELPIRISVLLSETIVLFALYWYVLEILIDLHPSTFFSSGIRNIYHE